MELKNANVKQVMNQMEYDDVSQGVMLLMVGLGMDLFVLWIQHG
jgi:hypothetical protein